MVKVKRNARKRRSWAPQIYCKSSWTPRIA